MTPSTPREGIHTPTPPSTAPPLLTTGRRRALSPLSLTRFEKPCFKWIERTKRGPKPWVVRPCYLTALRCVRQGFFFSSARLSIHGMHGQRTHEMTERDRLRRDPTPTSTVRECKSTMRRAPPLLPCLLFSHILSSALSLSSLSCPRSSLPPPSSLLPLLWVWRSGGACMAWRRCMKSWR